MDDRSVVHGVLFYTTVYINCILCAIAVLTGRWIFLLLIVLTIGLTAYMLYMTTNNSEHLESVGKWMEKAFHNIMDQVNTYWMVYKTSS